MARKRSITSAMGTDARIVRIARKDPMSAMIWPWFLTALDDWGRVEASDASEIGYEVLSAFPEEIKDAAMQSAINGYVEVGLVHRYQVGEKTYLAVRPSRWMKWQTYLKGSKRASTSPPIPAPSDPPWPQEEERELIWWLTKPSDRRQLAQSADSGDCPQTDGDVCGHPGMSVPTPYALQPSPSPSGNGIAKAIQGAHARDGDSRPKKASSKIKLQEVLSGLSPPVRDAMQEFIKARGKLKKPMTERAIELSIGKLKGIAGDDEGMQIAVINQAIELGWQTFYPLREASAKGGDGNAGMGGAGQGAHPPGQGDGGNAFSRKLGDKIARL